MSNGYSIKRKISFALSGANLIAGVAYLVYTFVAKNLGDFAYFLWYISELASMVNLMEGLGFFD